MHIHLVNGLQKNNNSSNTIWRGSVLTARCLQSHSGKLNHALLQAGGPTQSQLSRLMSSGHHISMEHRLRRRQLNSETIASNKTYLKETQEKRKAETFFFLRKWKKEKEIFSKKRKEKYRQEKKKEKRAQRGTSRDGSKTKKFFWKEMLQEISKQSRPKKLDFEQPRKKKRKKGKMKKWRKKKKEEKWRKMKKMKNMKK